MNWGRFLGVLTVLATMVTGPLTQERAMAAAAPAQQPGHGAELLWLLGGLAFSLTAAGVVAIAAVRSRRDH
ncbi:hypothetical protein [Streptomyces sp. NBC_00829]|uniref:hypothetical protein n=1 Tax=Streptomyces sp. NBC_00829 TaxID=2903679 RepID=UPI00386CC7FC|nr:hypothetical protein OG293_19450 [Streptomyces sp. NBC_00829]